MRRVLLLAVAVAATMMLTGASASTPVSCQAALSIHNNAQCSAGTINVTGEPELEVDVAIGPAEDVFSGDVSVRLQSSTGFIQRTCFYRVSNGFGTVPVCNDTSEGDFSDPVATCTGVGAGIGSWKVTCGIAEEG